MLGKKTENRVRYKFTDTNFQYYQTNIAELRVKEIKILSFLFQLNFFFEKCPHMIFSRFFQSGVVILNSFIFTICLFIHLQF